MRCSDTTYADLQFIATPGSRDAHAGLTRRRSYSWFGPVAQFPLLAVDAGLYAGRGTVYYLYCPTPQFSSVRFADY